jgi:hypothetical protein
MRYKLQIIGWIVSGIMSIGVGGYEGVIGYGYRFVYLGILAMIIAFLTFYITNMTDVYERIIRKQKRKLNNTK